MKKIEDMMSVSKESTEAFMKFGNVFAKGMEAMMKTCMDRAQEAGEKNANVMKSLMGCKSVNEFAEAQSRVAQESIEDAMNTTTQLSEMSVKMMMDAFAPLNEKLSSVMDKVKTA